MRTQSSFRMYSAICGQ